MSFAALPAEIIYAIATAADNCRDISALSRCNRSLHGQLTHLVYHWEGSGKRVASQWAAEKNSVPTLRIMRQMGIRVTECRVDMLHLAAANGSLDVINDILDNNDVSIEWMGQSSRCTAIIKAARHGRADAVRLLLDRGASPNAPPPPTRKGRGIVAKPHPPQEGPLHACIFRGYGEILSMLLAPGADIEARDHDGLTPAFVAVRRERPDALAQLLDAGADIHAEATAWGSLVDAAAQSNKDPAVMSLLVNHGALDSASALEKDFALRCAAQQGWKTVCERLLALGANAASRLDEFSGTTLEGALALNQPEVAELLVEHGADVHTRRHGDTPLHTAMQNGYVSVAKAIIRAGADVNAENAQGRVPIVYAIDDEVTRMLLARGADCNRVNALGWTMLLDAVSHRQRHACEVLLDAGAAVTIVNGASPLHTACEVNDAHIVGLLLRHGADVDETNTSGMTALYYAAGKGLADVVACLLQHGAKVDEGGRVEMTPLLIAAHHGETKVVELLLRHGAEADRANDALGSPLLAASVAGHGDAARLLLQHGADPHRPNRVGESPLLVAAAHGSDGVVAALLETPNIQIDALGRHGRTPLLRAAMRGHVGTVTALLAHTPPADANTTDHWGATALSLAVRGGHASTVTALLAAQDETQTRALLTQPDRRGAWPRPTRGPRRGAPPVYAAGVLLRCLWADGRVRAGRAGGVCPSCEDGFAMCRFCYDAGMRCVEGHEGWKRVECG